MLSFRFFNAMQNVKYVVLENKQPEGRRGNSVLGHHKIAAPEVSKINVGGGGRGWEGGRREKNRDCILKPKNLFNSQAASGSQVRQNGEERVQLPILDNAIMKEY